MTDTEEGERRTASIETTLSETGDEDNLSGSHVSGTAKRSLSGAAATFTFLVAAAAGLYHVLVPYVGTPGTFIHRPIHLMTMAVLVFLIHDATTNEPSNRIPWYDWLLAGVTVPSVLYLAYAIKIGDAAARAGNPTTPDLVFGSLTILLVLEMTRRTAGLILPIIASSFLGYALLGPMMPGMLAHRGYSVERIVSHLYMTDQGIFGIPLGVSATFVVVFIIFGAFLEVTGIGDWFIDLAYGYTGRMAGGPAKTSVLASGFMASLNGSAVANTATTGAFTIPLMRRTGFKRHYAAAVESAASSGGQIMPPVMGAGAFIMAVWTDFSYLEIIAAAVIPAFLYFLCVGTAVHFRAKRAGLDGLPADDLPDSWNLLKTGFHFTIPLVALVGLLATGYTPMLAGFYAILLTVVVAIPVSAVRTFAGAVRDGDAETVVDLTSRALQATASALDRGIRMTLIVAAACATAGIVVGAVNLTGLGLKFSAIVASLSGGVVLIGLLLTMVAAIILGMGLPTTAAYIVVAALGAPALTGLGVHELAAHMFIFYFAIISAITPPIMLAVFTASSIAESNPWRTGATAVNLALAGFLVPYLFVYGTELLLVGSALSIAGATATAVIGVIALSASTQGYLFETMSTVERAVLLVSAVALMLPGYETDIAGAVLGLVVVARQYRSVQTASGATASQAD